VVLGIAFTACVAVLTLYGERPLHFLMKPLGWLPFLSAHRQRWSRRGRSSAAAA